MMAFLADLVVDPYAIVAAVLMVAWVVFRTIADHRWRRARQTDAARLHDKPKRHFSDTGLADLDRSRRIREGGP